MQGLHRAAGVRGRLRSPSGFVERRGRNGNSRMAASGAITVVPWTQKHHSEIQCKAKICMFCRIRPRYILILKIIKLDPAKDGMKNLLESSKLIHLFWRAQGGLKTSSSLIGKWAWMSCCCIAMSAQMRILGCTQGCVISAGWTPMVWKGTLQTSGARLCLWGSTVSSLLLLPESWGHLCGATSFGV